MFKVTLRWVNTHHCKNVAKRTSVEEAIRTFSNKQEAWAFIKARRAGAAARVNIALVDIVVHQDDVLRWTLRKGKITV